MKTQTADEATTQLGSHAAREKRIKEEEKAKRMRTIPKGRLRLRDLPQELLQNWMTYDPTTETFQEKPNMPKVTTILYDNHDKRVMLNGVAYDFVKVYQKYHERKNTTTRTPTPIDDLDEL
jgi:hypothetical protein